MHLLETTKAEPAGFGLCFALRLLDRSSAADEVHDDRDQGEDKQQVDQKAAHVQNEEPAEPEQNQHHSQDEKHE
jgi:hypothetical protein